MLLQEFSYSKVYRKIVEILPERHIAITIAIGGINIPKKRYGNERRKNDIRTAVQHCNISHF